MESEKSVRQRKPTPKGAEYNKESKFKLLVDAWNKLSSDSSSIKMMLAENPEVEKAQSEFKKWMVVYESFLKANDTYCQLLEKEELEFHRKEWYEERDVWVTNIKTCVESWFTVKYDERKEKKAKSSKSKSTRSKSSSLLRLEEEQKKVELLARHKSLKEKQRIELQEIRIKQMKEENELKLEMEVAEARAKVLENYENKSNRSEKLNDDDVSQNLGSEKESESDESAAESVLRSDASSKVQHSVSIDGKSSLEKFLDDAYASMNYDDTPARKENNDDAKKIDDVLVTLQKPKLDLKKFSGDVIEFKRFMRHFKSRIEKGCNNDERMSYLDQFTVGEPNRIVVGYSYLDSDIGYPAALKELMERYGDPEVLANAYIKKVLTWSPIRADEPKALDNFAIFLSECEAATKCVGSLGVLEFSENLKSIINKLPYNLQEKWRTLVYKMKCDSRKIGFKQLVEFVRAESKKANDPVYGKDQFDTRRSNPKHTVRNKVGAVANVKTSATEIECWCCGSNHRLMQCPEFQKMEVSERVNVVQKNNLCFLCFRRGHQKKKCKSQMSCRLCKGRHNSFFHLERNTPEPVDDVDVDPSDVQPMRSISSAAMERDTECTLAIIPVKISLGWKTLKCYAFMDPGSNVSFCSKNLMNVLNANGKKINIKLDTMSDSRSLTTYTISGLIVSDLEGRNHVPMPKVYVKDVLPVGIVHIPTQHDISKWEHMKDVELPHLKDGAVELLIGNDVPEAYTPMDIRTGCCDDPHATKSLLGWIPWNVMRSRDGNDEHANVKSNFVNLAVGKEVENDRLEMLYRESLKYDFPERTIDDRKEWSNEDRMFMMKVENSCQLVNGHYEMVLPLRHDNIRLPDNEIYARRRLRGLEKKLRGNSQFKQDYINFMNGIIDKGYAELVPSDDKVDEGRAWYIPHHGVYHPKKPNKIRVVFDCSSKFAGLSLNDVLLPGPNLLSNLIGVLIRFRQHSIAMMSDIETMFYQVNVRSEYRNLLRFLWWPKGDLNVEPIKYRMTVHLFGASSSPACSNFALKRTAMDNQEKFSPEAVSTIMNNMYMDDCLKSIETKDEAISLISELKSMCLKGGFNLTKWITNDRDVLSSIPRNDLAKGVVDVDLQKSNLPTERALGITWNVETDTFNFKMSNVKMQSSRRAILSIVSSIYDPLGFISPLIIPAKSILQELCKSNVAWDEEGTGESKEKWERWCSNLDHLEKIQIRRCYVPPDFGKVVYREMHAFSDASNTGYGCVVYLRQTNDQGMIHCSFVIGKARVAPLKRVTIPRMELTAATTAVKITKVVLDELELPVNQTYYWTDSTAVLRYIYNDSARFHTFVANRVQLIREATDPRQWRYVESEINPADVASRGTSPCNLLVEQKWLNGPNFLWHTEDNWPKQIISSTMDQSDPEVKKSLVTQVLKVNHPLLLILQHYSSWHSIKKAVAYLLKLKDILLSRVRNKFTKADSKKCSCPYTILTINDLKDAEYTIIKYVQNQSFEREIAILKSNENNDSKLTRNISRSSTIFKLDPIMEDGLLRVGGRLNLADLPHDVKYPIILPKQSRISLLILREIHENSGHIGRNMMLSVLREKYWIIGANSLARTIVNKCVTCRRHRGKVMEQKMADLPSHRVTVDEAPFTNVGMDFFGPLHVKQRRSTVKRYGVIFVCLSSKAVHIEVAASLDTDACINVIRRFISRRGAVKNIRCDNGTNLVGAQREMKRELEAWNGHQIHDTLLQKGINWIFNPPAGSHHGGIWERQIRSIRKILHDLIAQQALTDDKLQTLLCEVESILNNRPITAPREDIADENPLTPNHLLLMKGNASLPPSLTDQNSSYYKRKWKQVQYLADIFWKRWINEYLPTLQQRQKWLVPKRNAKVGDVVLVVNESTPRNVWPLGRIIETFPNKDGLVRRVKVKTQTSEFVRPIDKLCLLLEEDYD